jgi:SAM-dependent methyltransferase
MVETLITQDEVNSRVYPARGISGAYRGKLLEPAEAMALLTYSQGLTGRNILDVGVGTGRTVRYLSPLARRYVCIDYSAELVEYVRATLPGTEVHLADMRDLTARDAAAFDFILATNSVFDAVPHDSRLKTLGEAHRVLSADGLLLFSSHNRR